MSRPTPTDSANRILQITRTFDAPREEVFRYLVEPALVAQWWEPDGIGTPVDQVEVETMAGVLHRKTTDAARCSALSRHHRLDPEWSER